MAFLYDLEGELASKRFGALEESINDTNEKSESLVLNYSPVNEKIEYYSISKIVNGFRKDKNGN